MSKVSTFSQRLKELLEIKNMKPSELSRLSGVSKSSLSHYMKGDWEGKQDAVFAIAAVTNVNENWLMGHDVPMDKSDRLNPDEKPEPSDDDIKFALFGGKDAITDEMFNEVKDFAKFIQQREQNKQK